MHQIEDGLVCRQGKAFTNFQKMSLGPQSDLAQPCNFLPGRRKGSCLPLLRASGSRNSVPGDRIFVPAQANAGPVGRNYGAVDNL